MPMMANLETREITKEDIPLVGDVYRNAYGEDIIIVRVKRYRRNGGGVTLETIMPIKDGLTHEMSLKRSISEVPYGYQITYNRSV